MKKDAKDAVELVALTFLSLIVIPVLLGTGAALALTIGFGISFGPEKVFAMTALVWILVALERWSR